MLGVMRQSQVAVIWYFSNSSIYKLETLSPSHFFLSPHTDMVTMFTQNRWQTKMLIWEIVLTSLWGKKKTSLKSYWYMVPGILMPFTIKQNSVFSSICNLFQSFIYSSDTWLLKESHNWTMDSHSERPGYYSRLSTATSWCENFDISIWYSHVKAASLTQSVKM